MHATFIHWGAEIIRAKDQNLHWNELPLCTPSECYPALVEYRPKNGSMAYSLIKRKCTEREMERSSSSWCVFNVQSSCPIDAIEPSHIKPSSSTLLNLNKSQEKVLSDEPSGRRWDERDWMGRDHLIERHIEGKPGILN
jgi:hypothetical protein